METPLVTRDDMRLDEVVRVSMGFLTFNQCLSPHPQHPPQSLDPMPSKPQRHALSREMRYSSELDEIARDT